MKDNFAEEEETLSDALRRCREEQLQQRRFELVKHWGASALVFAGFVALTSQSPIVALGVLAILSGVVLKNIQ